MPTAVLDRLLQTQFGKSLIMWFFLAMVAAIGGLCWYVIQQAAEIRECREDRVAAEREFGSERERIIREQITFYQSMLQRVQAIEEKRKKR